MTFINARSCFIGRETDCCPWSWCAIPGELIVISPISIVISTKGGGTKSILVPARHRYHYFSIAIPVDIQANGSCQCESVPIWIADGETCMKN